MATTKVASFKVVQEKHDAVFVVRKVIDGLNILVGVLGLGFTWFVLFFDFGVENIQNQNNGIGKMNVIVAKAILDGGDIFICLAKDLGVEEVGIRVYILHHKFK